jgi:hypothetical protein
LHRDNGMMMSAIISQKLQQDRIVEWSSKDVDFMKYKVDNFHICDIAEKYYKNDIISTQHTMCRRIECWKYLVQLTWTCDLLTFTWEIRDVKYYSATFWEKHEAEHDIYTMDNYRWSKLSSKMQRYIYPRLFDWWYDTNKFYYDLYKKSKNAPSKNNPEKHLERTVYECEVDLDKAEDQIKKDIIKYFKLCKQTNTTPWDTITS